MTDQQLHMIKHAWGFDSKEPGYRNHYCTEINDEHMMLLVADEYFDGPHGLGSYGADCGMFYLTDKAVEKLQSMKYIEMIEKKKKRLRPQQLPTNQAFS